MAGQKEPERGLAQVAQALIRQADEESDNILVEFWYFLRYNKKWWLAPIIVMLLMIGGLVVMSGSALAPFIYIFW